jgi:hypothetical protein
MSSWVHFTGGFGLNGFIFDENKFDNIENEILELVTPMLPSDTDSGKAACKININDRHSMHFADVLVSGDIRYADSLGAVEAWLLQIEERLPMKDWSIRCGVFYAYVEYRDPVIYYWTDCGEWKKISSFSGEILRNL